ncbi:hypothetical protein BHM03_00035649 [Ensete ventricosum]|nr:hypothetical protein BHM03_00035649 [Ensete ventricosum]
MAALGSVTEVVTREYPTVDLKSNSPSNHEVGANGGLAATECSVVPRPRHRRCRWSDRRGTPSIDGDLSNQKAGAVAAAHRAGWRRKTASACSRRLASVAFGAPPYAVANKLRL